jgi:hypothetical protein
VVSLPVGPALLCVAHPGHELRVHAWVALARPRVCVLTDGSGRSGASRLPSTRALLEGLGAAPGPIFGALSDADAYAALLGGRADAFVDLADRLADCLRREDIRYVAGDAAEGYNPMHDACRLVLNAAVAIASRRGSHVANFEFSLVDAPAAGDEAQRNGAIALRLSDDQLESKLESARRYADLAEDVDEAMRRFGAEGFRVELLHPAAPGAAHDGLPDMAPFYERHGERRVAAGKYGEVLRRQGHVLPLARALWAHVEAARA